MLYPLNTNSTFPTPSSPQPAAAILLPVSMNLTTLNSSYMWNHTVSFCDWFIPLSLMSSRFLHTEACGRIFFFSGWIILYCMYRPHSVHSSINGYVDCLHFPALVQNAAMNSVVQIALHDIAFNPFGYIPRIGMLFSIFYSFIIRTVFIPLN